MEDRILAMCELSNDLLFHKIPRERLGYYVDASLEAGRQLGGEPVVFLHYPPITQQNRCEELISVIREFGCRRVYYGHIHGSSGVAWAINGEVDGVTYRLVSCDSVGFTPVLVQQS